MKQERKQMVWKVLAPLDLTLQTDNFVQHAIEVAGAFGGELTLLYVVDHRELRRASWPPSAFAYDIHRVVLPGAPADTIASYAEFIKADVLLMPARGRNKRWGRFWTRSVSSDVMNSTRRAVCLTGLRMLNSGYRFRCRRIVCALRLDGTDDSVLLDAEILAKRCGAELILLSTVPESSERLLLETVQGLNRPLSPRVALERLRSLGERLCVPYKLSIKVGSPYKWIRLTAVEYAADLVVAARSSQEPGSDFGLDTRAVVRDLPCPLFTVFTGPAAVDTNGALLACANGD